MKRLLCALLIALTPTAIAEDFVEVNAPIQLFNGRDLSSFYTFLKGIGRDKDPNGVFTVQDGNIVISGEEWGCITSHQSFAKYHLVMEFRWGPKTWGNRIDKSRDSGLLVHSQGEDGGYSGTWMHSIECQIIEGGTGDFIVVGNGTDAYQLTAPVRYNPADKQYYFTPDGEPRTISSGRINWWGRSPDWEDVLDVRGPDDVESAVGEWSRLECVVDGPDITVYLNGALVNRANNVRPSSGRLQIQAEGADLHIRRIDLYPLAEPPAPMPASSLAASEYTDKLGNTLALANVPDWAAFRDRIRSQMRHLTGTFAPPPSVDELKPLRGEPVDMGTYTRQSLSIAVDGPEDRVTAWLLLPKQSDERAPGAIALHQTTPQGKDEPVGLSGDPELAYARELAERGFAVVVPDYPGYGDYKPSVYEMGYASATAKGIRNHMAFVSLLQALPEVDPKRIAAIGHSLGGHNSLFLALFDERVRAIASSCGFNAFQRYYEGDLTGWSHAGYMPRIAAVYGKSPARMPIDFTEILAAIAPRTVYINAPLHDSNFDVQGVRDCVVFATPAFEAQHAVGDLLVEYPDAAHTFPKAQREAAYRRIEIALAPR